MYTCSVCNDTFNGMRGLRTHYEIHNAALKILNGQVDEKSGDASAGSSKEALIASKTIASIVCHVCGKHFTGKGTLTSHMRIHTGEKPFECGVCGKCFYRKHHLSDHEHIHVGDSKFKCPICKRNFTKKNNLKRHLQVHRPHTCTRCGKKCTSAKALTQHSATHIKPKYDESSDESD